MRMAIAAPGNDFRLGGMEAPPAVISTYLGEDMTKYLTEFMNGDVKEYKPASSIIDLGVNILPKLKAPAEDRNRTSPFPYGGSRFEFRACGSSQVCDARSPYVHRYMSPMCIDEVYGSMSCVSIKGGVDQWVQYKNETVTASLPGLFLLECRHH